MKAGSQKKGAVEFDKLVIIVIALAVLLIVIIFFKTGFGSLGKSVGDVGTSAVGQKGAATGSISGAIGNVSNQWK